MPIGTAAATLPSKRSAVGQAPQNDGARKAAGLERRRGQHSRGARWAALAAGGASSSTHIAQRCAARGGAPAPAMREAARRRGRSASVRRSKAHAGQVCAPGSARWSHCERPHRHGPRWSAHAARWWGALPSSSTRPHRASTRAALSSAHTRTHAHLFDGEAHICAGCVLGWCRAPWALAGGGFQVGAVFHVKHAGAGHAFSAVGGLLSCGSSHFRAAARPVGAARSRSRCARRVRGDFWGAARRFCGGGVGGARRFFAGDCLRFVGRCARPTPRQPPALSLPPVLRPASACGPDRASHQHCARASGYGTYATWPGTTWLAGRSAPAALPPAAMSCPAT